MERPRRQLCNQDRVRGDDGYNHRSLNPYVPSKKSNPPQNQEKRSVSDQVVLKLKRC